MYRDENGVIMWVGRQATRPKRVELPAYITVEGSPEFVVLAALVGEGSRQRIELRIEDLAHLHRFIRDEWRRQRADDD